MYASSYQDLKAFPHNDQTIVGEDGMTLSGGQRLRVTLARALYRDSDVMILDDPLCAVDAEIKTHIYDRLF